MMGGLTLMATVQMDETGLNTDKEMETIVDIPEKKERVIAPADNATSQTVLNADGTATTPGQIGTRTTAAKKGVAMEYPE